MVEENKTHFYKDRPSLGGDPQFLDTAQLAIVRPDLDHIVLLNKNVNNGLFRASMISQKKQWCSADDRRTGRTKGAFLGYLSSRKLPGFTHSPSQIVPKAVKRRQRASQNSRHDELTC